MPPRSVRTQRTVPHVQTRQHGFDDLGQHRRGARPHGRIRCLVPSSRLQGESMHFDAVALDRTIRPRVLRFHPQGFHGMEALEHVETGKVVFDRGDRVPEREDPSPGPLAISIRSAHWAGTRLAVRPGALGLGIVSEERQHPATPNRGFGCQVRPTGSSFVGAHRLRHGCL